MPVHAWTHFAVIATIKTTPVQETETRLKKRPRGTGGNIGESSRDERVRGTWGSILGLRPPPRPHRIAGVEGVDAVTPHCHERARGEAIDGLPFTFDRGQRIAPDGALAPSLGRSRRT